MSPAREEEVLIDVLASLLGDCRHVAVGARSPLPAAAALLARASGERPAQVSLLGSEANSPFTDGGRELFDCTAQGRIDAFFLGGAQIDGAGNLNLVSIGDYERPRVRFAGCYGSAYLYLLIPRVILFTTEHSRRVLVPRVDFVSAPGASAPGVHRPGGPHALVTPRCVFRFDARAQGFTLAALLPGHEAGEVAEHTGFAYHLPPEGVPVLAPPPAGRLALLRGPVARELGELYPTLAARLAAPASAPDEP